MLCTILFIIITSVVINKTHTFFYIVTIGGIMGHAMCTGLAVVGGKLLAAKISERQVALAGGILFWVFAIHSLVTGPEN